MVRNLGWDTRGEQELGGELMSIDWRNFRVRARDLLRYTRVLDEYKRPPTSGAHIQFNLGLGDRGLSVT